MTIYSQRSMNPKLRNDYDCFRLFLESYLYLRVIQCNFNNSLRGCQKNPGQIRCSLDFQVYNCVRVFHKSLIEHSMVIPAFHRRSKSMPTYLSKQEVRRLCNSRRFSHNRALLQYIFGYAIGLWWKRTDCCKGLHMEREVS